MYRDKKSGSKKKKNIILACVAAALLVVGSYAVFRVFYHNNRPPAITGTDGINLEPPTEQDKQESDQNKDRIVEEQNQSSGTSQNTGTKQVGVVITNATADSVNAYVTGVLEENGTCSATFTQGSTTITRTSSGFGNVSYTQCAPITPNLPNTNTWSVVVSYSSPSAAGKSQAQTF